MSDDQLDNDLRDRIKQVFDNYEDNTAKEGWLLLREKYPEKERPRIVPLYWRVAGIAALLLVALSVGLWLNFRPVTKQIALVVKNVKHSHAAPLSVPGNKNNRNLTNTQLNSNTQIVAKNKQALSTVKPAVNHQQQTNKINPANTIAATTATIAITPTKGKPTQTATSAAAAPAFAAIVKQNPKTEKPIINNQEYIGDSVIRIATVKPVKEQAPLVKNGNNNNNSTANTTATVVATTAKPVQSTQSIIVQNKPAKSIESYLEQDDRYRAAQNTDATKIKYKKVSFSVYAATYVNYAKGSANQFNAGAGFTTDIKLTDNLSLSTGVAIAQNTLSYDNGNNGLAVDAPAVFTTAASHNYMPTINQLSEITPVSRNLNANLVDLDIPVDLKYVFDPEKANTYFAAGLSSGTFINETYNYTYNYTTPNNPALQQSQQSSTHNTFDNFYFAKMLNLSFGMGYNIGKTQLIIEPFFKYPLTGLGDQHILFGSGGLNLKINLDPSKKSQ
jgi:hypothetical protein